ncbi:arylamine N-acetyltransferase family protein [Actinokineospora xionganensis]|uniref:Arylamine N-acetyltransferase n=1 Tax=Actinokineospora xionganensis TaxID=2684470 RepID=A0ABR7LDB8_9PSEU|nr:arylamine N-acetyltransferase [Actinokineospora xionganensis]MBC6450675.1 arylamine N-acetyltransferase [Actinokineospora xionganensis]
MTKLSPAPDWATEDLDLDSYLARIDHPRVAPSLDALRSLHIAHVRAIPFENIGVLVDGPPDLSVKAVAAKMVDRARGGYCFEHAPLFAAAAEQLGFTVRRRLGRVGPQRSGPRTHALLVVTVDGADHLVDVGFGASIWQPMPLIDGSEVDQAGWPHQVRKTDLGWSLWRLTKDGWEPEHEFEDVPQLAVDFEVGNHYAATGPGSPFPGKLIVKRLSEGVSRRLVGNELSVEYPDGRTETTTIGYDQLGEVLPGLDIDLTPDELDAVRVKLGA